MAQSASHKFGQIIGDTLEVALTPLLRNFCIEQNLYLDIKGPRPARRGNKLSWTDSYGNTHDLDFVIERGGTDENIGTPVAFIESAWRRYTKHSRNKAQEIQGAVLPLVERYRNSAPFKGAILAGVFTEGALTQLRSIGFSVLYFPYETIIEAFRMVGIDASFDEDTPEEVFEEKIRACEDLTSQALTNVANSFLELNNREVERFMRKLTSSITRRIDLVRILPLHGDSVDLSTVNEAIDFIANYDEEDNVKPIVKYEIEIRYNNGDNITAQFADKEDTIQFLQNYVTTPIL